MSKDTEQVLVPGAAVEDVGTVNALVNTLREAEGLDGLSDEEQAALGADDPDWEILDPEAVARARALLATPA